MSIAGHADPAALASRLAGSLAAAGDITDPAWREAFARVPRHVFVPHCAVTADTDGGTRYTLLDGRDPAWLEAAYSDQTLVTQVEGRPVEEALAGGTGYGWPTSSSTAPGLMAWMLHTLDIRDGHRVLEIGTGTGYNAALLCERLGSANVTTVEIDPELASLARGRLGSLGYHPEVIAADGRLGHPDGAPYDRIIATASWPYLPLAWIAQAAPAGKILANITGLLGGAMLLAAVRDSTAVGRFLPRWAGFMTARPALPRVADIQAADTEDGAFDTGTTRLDPALLQDPAFAFTAQLHIGDARPYWGTHEDGRELYGLISPDGSWAEVYPPDASGDRCADQGGPRRLWDLTEQAYRFWEGHGRPCWSHFGVTATAAAQHAWYGNPGGGDTWLLPLPAWASKLESRLVVIGDQ